MPDNNQPAQAKPVRITDLNDVMQSFKQVWEGVQNWFSPGKPVEPVQPEPEPRVRQMPVGSNIQYVPRGTEATSFEQLRFFYTNYDVAGIAIQARIEQLQGIEWNVVAKGDSKGDAAKTKGAAGDKYKTEINLATEFFNKPDGQHKWDPWLRMILEQRLVLDALTLWPRPNRGGQLYGVDVIDGATIKPLVDIRGAIPDAPAPAFQQILYGMPRGVYTNGGPLLGDPGVPKDQRLLPLLYVPQNVRAHSVYGYPEIEKVLIIVNTALRKRMQDLAHFTDGNIPRALVGVPSEWSADQIRKYQEYWDSMMAGELNRRSRIWFTSVAGRAGGGIPVKEFVEFNGNPEFDLWLLKLTLAALRMTPTEIGFTDDVNRATSEEQGNVQNRSSIRPLTKYVKSTCDTILTDYLNMPFLEFQFQIDEAEDQLEKAQATKIYVDMGAVQVDEVRAELGRKPYGTPPWMMGPTGPILIDNIKEMGQASLDQAKTSALGPHGAGPDGSGPGEWPKNPQGQLGARATGMAGTGHKTPAGTSGRNTPAGMDDGDDDTTKSIDAETCCTGNLRKAQRYVFLESYGLEKSGPGDYDGVDIDWHQTFTDGTRSPDLGEPLPGAVEAIQHFLDAGLTVYLSCGGLSDPDGAELAQRMRNHLLMHGIDPDEGVVFRAKPRTLAVIDDRAVPFDGDWNRICQNVLARQAGMTKMFPAPVPALFGDPLDTSKGFKPAANYTDQAKDQFCSECIFFNPDSRTCDRVFGTIEPNGHCDWWVPDPEGGDNPDSVSGASVNAAVLSQTHDVMGEHGRTTGQMSATGEPTRKAAYQLARDDVRRWRTVVQKCVKSNMAIRPFNSEHIPPFLKQQVEHELEDLTRFGAPNRPQFVTSVFAKAIQVLDAAEQSGE